MERNIAFLITTYNRQESLKKLVNAISEYGDIFIIDDGSDPIVSISPELIKNHKAYIGHKEHGGKKGYWKTVNELFYFIIGKSYDYYFMIPDDFLPVDQFVEKSIATWDKITDPKKICINVYVSQGRYKLKNWTNFKTIESDYYRQTQWVDMCFMCESRFFLALGWIPRIVLDWDSRPELSSGVGSYISKKLNLQEYGIYQTKTSMFIPQEEAFRSKMNPWREIDDPINIPIL